MSDYITFTTGDGATILIEAAEAEIVEPGVVKAGLKEEVEKAVAEAKVSFERGLEIVRYNADAFIKKVRSLSDPPHEVEITFGLKATGEVGNFAVAKAGTEANYTVKLTWKREEDNKEAEG